VDASFLVNKYIPIRSVKPASAQPAVRACKTWWSEIDRQIANERARLYVPDVCIAETFKVLARKYYNDAAFKFSAEYKTARDKLIRDVRTPDRVLKAQDRYIRYHDLPTSRDIIIAIDRFYEMFMKHGKAVSVADLILVAGAKYLMDFYDIPRRQLHIVTLDDKLRSGIARITELPNAYDPTRSADRFDIVFD
jgi:hypothetical protein